MEVCIKKIREDDWGYFKSEAVKKNVPMGKFFSIVVGVYKKRDNEGNNWDEILNSRPVLDRNSVDDIEKEIERFRNEEVDFRY